MKYEKIQIELLKEVSKEKDKQKMHRWNYKLYDDEVMVTEGHYCVFIPKDKWFLDIEKVFAGKTSLTMEPKDMTNDSEPIIDTHQLKIIDDGKSVHIFKNDKDEEFYVDEKLLKVIANDKYDTLHYEGSTPKKPIAIYNYENDLLGIICPVVK